MDGASVEFIPSSSCSPIPKMAWNLSPQPICSFEQVMSEELAKSLERRQEEAYKRREWVNVDEYGKEDIPEDLDPNCSNDYLLAQVLQAEFDKEHDELLNREEKKFNGTSKVTVSFKNYRKVTEALPSDDDDSSDNDWELPKHWDTFEHAEKTSPVIGKSGISKQGSVITTKHDTNICSRRNACRIMGFPPGIETGDGGGFDMRLPNAVYNTLKVYSASEEKRAKRLHDKVEKSTAVQALDPKTRLLLYKLVNAETLEGVNGCISTGKEAVIFHAFGGQSEDKKVPNECAVKVFKTTLNEFKTRDKYIRNDYRFKERLGKQNPRKIIPLWAEKEMHNLQKLKTGGVLCPDVVILKKHILVMSFIGSDQIPAPKLKDANLSLDQMKVAYNKVYEAMKRMYVTCRLVHADLSEYNILWFDNKAWIIDVSQTVEITHPCAMEFLFRDCSNISTFFSKAGLSDIPTPEQLFKEISDMGVPIEGPELLARIKDFDRNEELLMNGIVEKPYPFNTVFDQSLHNVQYSEAVASSSV